jgi:hypothetical protein
MTNPAMNWLRSVVLAVARQARTEQWLIAAYIAQQK